MIQINQKWNRMLDFIFTYSNKEFTIRQISKKTNIPTATAHRYIKYLKKQGLLSENNTLNIIPYTRFLKAFFIIEKLFEYGLIYYLDSHFNPSIIIIFGSVRKGEYDKESDIDLFIESVKEPKVDLSAFEKKIGHKIQLFIRKDIKDLPDNLFNNVLNGIKLTGYIKIK